MKPTAILATAAALLAPCATAFTAPAASSAIIGGRTITAARPLHATLTADELNTMSKEEQLKVLGVASEDKLALGIDADEVLEFIGTRDDLVAKFQADIPQFSQSDAEAEVDKFLMDGEMLDLWIKYTQRKREDPDWEPQYAPEEGPVVKVVNFVSQYAIYILLGIVLKDVVTAYMDKNGGGGGEAEVLVSSVMDGVQHLTNTMV